MKFILSGPIKGVSKSHTLWVEGGVRFHPLVFFRKPKWVTNDAAWENFIHGVFTSLSPEGRAALNELLESAVLDREASND